MRKGQKRRRKKKRIRKKDTTTIIIERRSRIINENTREKNKTKQRKTILKKWRRYGKRKKI